MIANIILSFLQNIYGMKNIVFILLLCVLGNYIVAQNINTSKGIYFGLKTGYTIAVAKSTIGSPRSEVGNRIIFSSNEGGFSYSEKNPFGSRGAGIIIAGSVGYMFSENFGLEMELSFLRGTQILDASRNESLLDTIGNSTRRYFSEQFSYTNMLRASPMLVVSGDPSKKFIPYAKFGVLLPLAGKTIIEVNINDETGELAKDLLPVLNTELADSIASKGLNIPITTTSNIKAKTSGVFSLGFTAKFGGAYKVNNKWLIFGELEMNMLSVKSKETEFVDFYAEVPEALVLLAESFLEIDNIQNVYGFEDLPEILRLTIYEDEITESSNSTYTSERKNEPFQQLTFRDNYNSFGLLLGIRYMF